jgi:hypothetical protein
MIYEKYYTIELEVANLGAEFLDINPCSGNYTNELTWFFIR